MTPEELSAAISACLKDAVAAGELALSESALPEDVRVERPKNREHGDWATNIALQLAKHAGTNPREFATILGKRLEAIHGVTAVDIAGPGFLNITVDAAAAGALAKAIVEAGSSYGTNQALAGHVVNMEFVSANPTDRCTSATRVGRPWEIRLPASSAPPVRTSPRSTTSTTPARR
ncbi:arginine--tRNA ligase [Arthrobacter sp. Hiyo8]|nr:arginine--tRNA ligase [Arthrobacter sp. Hiyo8]